MSGPADRSSLGGIFDMTGVTRGPDGIKRYAGLPLNLVHMLRTAVEGQGAAEAVAETGGGPRLVRGGAEVHAFIGLGGFADQNRIDV